MIYWLQVPVIDCTAFAFKRCIIDLHEQSKCKYWFLPFSNLHQVLFSNTEELLPVALPQIIRDSSHKERGTFTTWRDRGIHLQEYMLKASCIRFSSPEKNPTCNTSMQFSLTILEDYLATLGEISTLTFVSQLVGFYHLHPAMWIPNLGAEKISAR